MIYYSLFHNILRDKFDRLPSISSGGSDSGAVDLFYNHTEGPLVSVPWSVRKLDSSLLGSIRHYVN